MSDILREKICAVFDTEHLIGRLEEFQQAAFKAGFKWSSGHTEPLYLGEACSIHLNIWGGGLMTRSSKLSLEGCTELSVDFLMQKLKEAYAGYGAEPEEPDEEFDDSWEDWG